MIAQNTRKLLHKWEEKITIQGQHKYVKSLTTDNIRPRKYVYKWGQSQPYNPVLYGWVKPNPQILRKYILFVAYYQLPSKVNKLKLSQNSVNDSWPSLCN